MRLIDIVSGPWAITPDAHREILDIYRRHLKGDKIDIQSLGIEKRNPLASAALSAAGEGRRIEDRGTFTVIDDVAIIPVQDTIAKRMSWFMNVCGGCSTQILMRDYAAAQNDPTVSGIIMYFDTPGGTVDGTAEAANLMLQSRGNKPVVGFSDGMICSAGYWLAAPCDSIFISSDTNPIGSIGVVAAHVDVSKGMEMSGRRVTEITAGDYKRVASSYAPLTQPGRDYIQAQLDHIYTAFTDFAAACRDGLSIDSHKEWADGQVFLGSQAIDCGLVDGVSTLDDLIGQLSTGTMQPGQPMKQRQKKQPSGTGAVADTTISQEGVMTKEELKAKDAPLYQAIFDEGKEAAAGDTAAAVTAEASRIGGLVNAAFGEDAGKKFAAVVGKGLSAEDIQTLGITFTGSAEDKTDTTSRKEILEAITTNGQKPVGKVVTVEADGDKDFMVLVKEHQAANPGATLTDAMRAAAKDHPVAHEAYITKANEGRK